MAKSTTKFLNNLLEESLEAIDPRLRVSTGMEGMLRACDKEFSLCANYPKGHGELFCTWMKENHPGALLLHVERTAGSRQDLIVEGAGAIFWNRPFWVEFLDKRLRLPAGNILQENLLLFFHLWKWLHFHVYMLLYTFQYVSQSDGLQQIVIH